MRPKKIIKSLYGRQMLLKRFCPDCRMYAIIIKNEFSCCGKSINDWDQKFDIKKKRESEVAGKRNHLPRKEKQRILRFQNHQCVYCGIEFKKGIRIEYDHFIPFVFSGDNNLLNMVASCRECNQIKTDYIFSSIEEARIYILGERERKRLSNCDYFGGRYEVSKI